jgi:DnaJ-class molecular chaperone
MLKLLRPKLSSILCRHCSGIGLVAALAIVPCGCGNAAEGVRGRTCSHCAGSGAIEIEVEDACPSCRGTALNKRRAT